MISHQRWNIQNLQKPGIGQKPIYMARSGEWVNNPSRPPSLQGLVMVALPSTVPMAKDLTTSWGTTAKTMLTTTTQSTCGSIRYTCIRTCTHACTHTCMRTCFMLLWRFQCIQLKIFPDTQQTLVYYLVMHAHMKADSTVDTLWVLHETR